MTMQLSDEVRQYDLTKTLQDCERAYQRGYLHGVSRGITPSGRSPTNRPQDVSEATGG